ncbi:hypothetical protein LCM02_03575 [Lutimonas saemankumensis]|uniref:hypothetical protein n=1 Tax=Lutimonas saemankumensis TaxID=483016 RepID=UPI001CD62614|nr:hypothetical protein [Lutimonas saemankumensis]MCA0931519.1 hypothetical protein [Lutimonas saemankumensis]
MKILRFFSLPLLMIFLYSCSSDSDDDPGSDPPVNDITYTKNVKPIIDARCISCHSNPPTNNAPMSLVTYNNVRSAVTGRDLIGSVESGAMPPSGADLTNAQIQILKDWQDGGFKE